MSVVVPAYQAEATVGATISSLLWQTYPDFEVIVVDDGSSDATAAVVSAPEDPRVRLIRQDNAGPGAARNRGMADARGELVAFVDADDVLMPDYLSACVAVWARHGGIVTSNAFWMFPGGIDPRLTRHRGPLPSPERQRMALLESNWVSIMSIFPRRLVDQIGGVDTSLPGSEDWDFWLRAVFAGWIVHHQPRPLALFNRSQVSETSWRARVYDSERVILQRMADREDLRGEERVYLRRRLASPAPGALVEAAEAELRAGSYRAASRQFAEAAALLPSERLLVLKARLLRLAPPLAGPALRRRDRGRLDRLGTTPVSDEPWTRPAD